MHSSSIIADYCVAWTIARTIATANNYCSDTPCGIHPFSEHPKIGVSAPAPCKDPRKSSQMGKNPRSLTIGHARVKTRVLKNTSILGASFKLDIVSQRAGAFLNTRASNKKTFKHSYTAKCRNRLRVGVCALQTRGCVSAPLRFQWGR